MPVHVKTLHGVTEMGIDKGDKVLDVDKCPRCKNPFNTRADLKFITTKEEKP